LEKTSGSERVRMEKLREIYRFVGVIVDECCKTEGVLNGLKYSFAATVGFVIVMVTDSIGLMDYSLEPYLRGIMSISATWTFVAIIAFTLFFNLISGSFYRKISWQIVFYNLIPVFTFIIVSVLRMWLGYAVLTNGDSLSGRKMAK